MLRHDAIYATHNNVVTIRGNGADEKCYDKDENIITIDESLVTAKLAETEYQDKRRAEYPSIINQLDLLYHDISANKLDATGEWYKLIKATKDKYPKE
tara:strand:- start:2 stop:295 length:294 start_codon:yes stop_codon:yes gene_type:complete